MEIRCLKKASRAIRKAARAAQASSAGRGNTPTVRVEKGSSISQSRGNRKSRSRRSNLSLPTVTDSPPKPSISALPTDQSPGYYDPLCQEEARRLQQTIYDHPEKYWTEILGISPWGKQLDIVQSVKDHEKTLVASCVSSGKSFTGGAIVPWWLNSWDLARVFIIAPTERQIKINLWGELTNIYNRSRIPLGGELLTLDWRLGDNWYAKGFSPGDAFSAFGFHGPHDLFIFDDAQGIGLDIYDAFENAAASGMARFLFLCNPAVVSGLVYEACTRQRPEINLIRIEAKDTPNVASGQILVPGLLVKSKVDEWVKKYGWDSNFVRVKVRALPPKQEADTLIPIDWLELATQREVIAQGPMVIGVDVARFGDDQSIIAARNGRQMLPIPDEWQMQGYDTMEVTGAVVRAITALQANDVYLDVIGVGGGPVDRLHEIQNERSSKISRAVNICGVNVGEKAFAEDEFVNLRSEAWWAARDSLNPENMAAMAIPNDPELIGDLSCVKYTIRSDGRIEVESKQNTKDRLGHSPDKGDAYVMMVFKQYLTRSTPVGIQEKRVGLPPRPAWLR